MRWSESVTLGFVKIYLKHECLWNPAHPDYKLKSQRDKAYAAISSEFRSATTKSLSIPEIKLKIKNLRTTYVQQVHKILQKSSPDSIYEPSLVWFNEMDQCLKHVSTNRHSSTSSNTIQETPEVDSSSQIWVDHELSTENSDANPDPLIGQVTDKFDNAEQGHEINTRKIKSQKHSITLTYKKNKKKKVKHFNTGHDYIPDSNVESVVKEDEFDIYGKYIATQLRSMELQKALRLQLEIQSLVSEARISDMSSD